MIRLLTFLLGLGLAGAAVAQPRVAAPPAAADSSLEFVANRGQWPAPVQYGAAMPGGHLYLEPTALRYVLLQALPHPGHLRPGAAGPVAAGSGAAVRGHQLRVQLVGAQASGLAPAQATGAVRHYLHGADPARWAHAVPSFRQVRYQQPWPGVALRFYENDTHHLEYDFELAPGADPARVRLRYEGATRLVLRPDGQLHVATSVAELTELRPRAYQPDPASGLRKPVACAYVLDEHTGEVSFQLGAYDPSRPLVIDPTVVFSTYSGATGSNWGFTATYDAAGNLYSGGIVLDDGQALPGFPTTPGAFQTTFAAVVDIALIKYNTGVSGPAARVWATYLGGNGLDLPSSLVVNTAGELLVLGTTGSTNYPTTTGAVQRSFGGGTPVLPFGFGGTAYEMPTGSDLVVSRLAADGSALQASTYLGGSRNDGVAAYDPASATRQLPQNYGDPLRGDILTDAAGNVYVASVTASPNFPTTPGSFGPTARGGDTDAVIAKLPPSLTALTWSGRLGGSAADAAYSVQLDPAGRVYVAGGTLSPTLPGANGYQPTRPGDVDGFVARLAADGSAVQRLTYLGTSAYDQAYFVQLGSDGGVYVLGQTLGSWPVSPGVYSNPGSRQFIQKLSPDLDAALLSTVIGSGRPTLDFTPTAFLVDQCDRVYACGWGGMVNQFTYYYPGFVNQNGYTHGLPTTPNAVRTTPDDPTAGSDFYLAQLSPGLGSLVYGTYYGDPTPNSEGDHVDGGTSRFDPRGVVYQAVCSCFQYNGFPVPPGANTYSATNGSATGGGSYACNNAAFKIDFVPTAASVGAARTVCVTAPALALSGTPAGGVWTGPGVSGSVATGYVFTPSLALVGTQTLTYTVPAATVVCTSTATLQVTVEVPAAVAALPPLCVDAGPVRLTGGTPAGGTWSGPGVSGSVAAGFTFTPTNALAGTQTLTYTVASAGACGAGSNQARVPVQVLASLPLAVVPLPAPCPTAAVVPYTVRFQQTAALPAGAVLEWFFGDDSTAVTGLDVTHVYRQPGTYRPRVQVSYADGRCPRWQALPLVTVQDLFIPNIITPGSDQLNSSFQPRLGGCPPRLQVFSRWGRQVYEDAAYQGTWAAEGLAAGLYYYLLTPADGSPPRKGWVEVVR